MKRKLYTLAALICLLFTVILTAHADFGSYSGDSDYGSYDDYSWDSYDYSSYDDDDDYGHSSYDDYDYGYSGGYSSTYNDFELSDDASAVLGALIVLAVVYLILRNRRRERKARASARRPAGATRTAASTLRPMSEYQTIDPAFDVAAMQEELSNLYVKMQNAWTDKDIEPLRPYFTDAFFTQMERQLDQMRRQGVTNYVERIAVLRVSLKGFRQQGGEDHIIAELYTRIVDYTLNDKTGKLVSGSQKKEKFMTYEWDLSRTTGMRVLGQSGIDTSVCPSCGAPLDINVSARCPYCGSVITRSEHTWAVCSIKGISQQTAK